MHLIKIARNNTYLIEISIYETLEAGYTYTYIKNKSIITKSLAGDCVSVIGFCDD